jgi:hypothetical protein
MNMWELCHLNEKLASAYANVIVGKPDIFDVDETHSTLKAAIASAVRQQWLHTLRYAGPDRDRFGCAGCTWSIQGLEIVEAARLSLPDNEDDAVAAITKHLWY